VIAPKVMTRELAPPDPDCRRGRDSRGTLTPTVVFCDLIDRCRQLCPRCGQVGVYRDTVARRATDVYVAGHPLLLRVRIRRYLVHHRHV
jgi:hypothetical protein